MEHFVELRDVCKRYRMGEVTITASDHVSFTIEKGEFAVIVGPSGAGKTTLLNILGGMDTCDEGSILVDGQDVSACKGKRLIDYRRYDIGFVFQFYNLIQNLTAEENVELASQICRDPMDPASVLEKVGLADRAKNFPSQLSGGEQQRVAIARALAKNPKLRSAMSRPRARLRHGSASSRCSGLLPKEADRRVNTPQLAIARWQTASFTSTAAG
jgi:putative ABC transport system ATP-binding protein